MAENRNSPDLLRAILVLVATAGTIVFNALAAMGYINGVTPEMVSDKYPTVITPAGYAFSIWSLIYVGLIAFSIYQILPANRERFRHIRSAYIVSCVLNCAWIYFWHGDRIALCFGIIILLAATLVYLCLKLKDPIGPGEYWAVKAPFGIYAGWVTAATIVNFVVMLRYLGVDMTGNSASIIGIVCIAIAAALAVLGRIFLNNFLYPLAISWALAAIAINQSGKTVFVVVAAVLGVVVGLITSISFVLNLPTMEDRIKAEHRQG
jgi:hypothetical protein